MTKYVFREGAWVKGVDAQTVGETLDGIRERHGKLETTQVVEEARPKDSPIHPAFEWRDKMAAEEYRKEQARRIIRSVRVVVDERTETEPAFIHITSAEGKGPGHYQTPSIVAQDVDQYERAMSHALMKMRAAERAVEDLRRAASESESKDRLAQINIILKSLSTAGRVLQEIH